MSPTIATGSLVCSETWALSTRSSGRIDEAFKAAGNSRDLLEGVVRDHPEDLNFQYSLAWTMGWIGGVPSHWWTDRQAKLSCDYRRSIELFERLVRENPEVRTYPLSLANGYCYLGQVLRQAGQEPEASDMSRKCLTLFERIDKGRPGKTVRSGLYPFPLQRPGQIDRGRAQRPPSDRVAWPIRPWKCSGRRSMAAIGICLDRIRRTTWTPCGRAMTTRPLSTKSRPRGALSKKLEETAAKP